MPASFGWILQGWVERIQKWDAARTALAKIDRKSDPGKAYLAEWEVTDALAACERYKQEMVRGLAMVIGWLAKDPAFADTLSALFAGIVHDRTADLVERVRVLELKLESLTTERDQRERQLLEGTEGGRGEQQPPPRHAGGRGLHFANGRDRGHS